jgi:DNA-binding NtrC family response regulator
LQLLLIEDNDDLRIEIREYLVRQRHDVTALGSIAEARHTLGRMLSTGAPLDAVICDVNLNDGDGVDLYVEFGPRRPDLPWILMSGDADPQRVTDERKRHRDLPPCTVVQKPVSLRNLVGLLARGSAGV